ncbi:unnamed protein product [Phaedon cochleariae]|uniref:Uncharacterized protein n=1 Tax=Phaedon cochleariae TaxID=80249 RepID=A0A9P0DHM1_PHACE|nr:unnamed protein product [Phaedon cochleariae]
MYFRHVNTRHSSCPSISCPIINITENSLKNRSSKKLHPTFPMHKYDKTTNPGRYNENVIKLPRNLYTQLKSPSSEELQAILQGSLLSIPEKEELPNFAQYWKHQLLVHKAIQNFNMHTPEYRNKGCLCKPVYKLKQDSSDNNHSVNKRRGCPCKPTEIHQMQEVIDLVGASQIDQEQANKDTQKDPSQDSISKASEKIKVCLPLDLEKLGKDSSGKTIKLIIYGDKTHCDCKGCNSNRSGDKSSSNECLACALARSPQMKNLYSGWSDEKVEKTSNKQRKGFPSRLSEVLASKLSFLKKKQKSSPSCHCSDKCAQTCGVSKLDSAVETTRTAGATSKVDRACSCICCSKNEEETNTERSEQTASKTDPCKCPRCGKFDIEKLTIVSPGPNSYQDDCLKWVLKMEAKQNYRQIKCILKELKEQRQEIRGLHKRYTSLIKLRINHSSDEYVEKYKTIMKNRREKERDEVEWISKSKDMKNAINQSTLSEQNGYEENNKTLSPVDNTSTLSLFEEDSTKTPKVNCVDGEKPDDVAEKDSCTCTLKSSCKQRFRNFWRSFRGKRRECYQECDCPASKPIEKCKNFLVKNYKKATK